MLKETTGKIKVHGQDIHIQYVPVNLLKPSTYNPRVWNQKTIDDLTQSIKKNGFLIPILANSAKGREQVVISGHFRLKVAKDLGYKTVPVTYISIPDIEKEKRLNLTINRVSGDWDYELLKSFDIEALLESGFDDLDLSHIWDENLSVEDDEFDIDKAISKIKTPKTKNGDLIYFGENGWHRLLCADSTDPLVATRLVGNDKISILDYDPPYNNGLDYIKGIGTKGKYGSRKVNDRKPDNEYRSFLKTVLQNGLSHTYPDVHVFCWCDESYIGMIQNLYEELGIKNKRVCLWVKNSQNPTPQIAFSKAFEPCVYGTIGNPYLSPNITNLNEILNREVGTGNRLPDDILDLFDIWLVRRDPTSEYSHPTQKPFSLYEKPLRRCSKAGDIVLDLFAGSGPLLSACEQLKRRAFLVEIDPVFCDVIVDRYKQLTSKEVIYVSSEK